HERDGATPPERPPGASSAPPPGLLLARPVRRPARTLARAFRPGAPPRDRHGGSARASAGDLCRDARFPRPARVAAGRLPRAQQEAVLGDRRRRPGTAAGALRGAECTPP